MIVIERFLQNAKTQPEADAVVVGEDRTTYGVLRDMVAGLAEQLRQRGARHVLIALPQGVHAYATMLASLAAGATYAPLNMAAPESKRQLIAEAFKPDLIIAEPAEASRLALGVPALATADIDALAAAKAPCPVIASDSAAYVIFTSGSTGTPKGVVIGRPALAHYVDWIGTSLQPGPQDRISQYANIAFDLSVLEIYGAMCFGAALHPVRAFADRMRPARMIARDKITVWVSVPSVIGLMRQALDLTPTLLGGIRRFVFCGEALMPQDAEALLAAAPGAVIQNTYGPTEATVSMTSILLTSETLSAATSQSVAIGEPIGGMRLLLAGGANEDEGEIVIAGPQLADGYLKNSAATERAFRTIETAEGPLRAYFTGDWASRRNGYVFFAERIDLQIKHKGHRIEAGEITAALASVGYVGACVFQAEQQLVAVVEGTGDPLKLRQSLSVRLENYAVPDVILFVQTLPRSANDKIDRAAVTSLYLAHAAQPRSAA